MDATLAGFALDLHGRPRIVGRSVARSAAAWLRLRPAHLILGPHASARVTVEATAPPHASPGDHDALVVLSARPLADAQLSVRLRLGVVVVVRAPGAVVRRLKLGRLRVTRKGGQRTLELEVANAGNVTEPLRRVRAIVSRARAGRRIAAVAAASRELRPKTRGLLEFRLRARAEGPMLARVVIPADSGRAAIHRTYRIRL